MANSAISQVGCRDSIILKGRAKAIYANGKLAANYKPGTVVYKSAAETWTQTGGVTASRFMLPGVVEFIYRTDTAFGATSIDGAITDGTVRNCRILVGPRGDPDFEFAAFCINPGAASYGGQGWTNSSGGKFKLTVNAKKIGSDKNVAYTGEWGIGNGDTAGRFTW